MFQSDSRFLFFTTDSVVKNRNRESLKTAEHLRPVRFSERLGEDREPDMYALQGVYYSNDDTSRCKKGKNHAVSTDTHDMLQRL